MRCVTPHDGESRAQTTRAHAVGGWAQRLVGGEQLAGGAAHAARSLETLERGARSSPANRTQRQCAHLLEREAMLWTFVENERVPLTNNLAERAIRTHVIWRKRSFATHSNGAMAFRERVMSVAMTARQQGVPVYEYLRRICAESLRSEGVTTLLPLAPAPLPLISADG